MKTYRCWYRDGSARTIDQESHEGAAKEAQELAGLDNGPVPTDPVEKKRYLAACKVKRTECLTDGLTRNWK